MILAIALATGQPGNVALTQFVISIASGGTLIVLTVIARQARKFMREHEWLVNQVNENSQAIKKLLEERQPTVRRSR